MKTKTSIARTACPKAVAMRLTTPCAPRLLLLLLLLALPAVVRAQFNYTTTDGTITITEYTGPGGAVVIPSAVHGVPVTRIGDSAFYDCTGLTSVTIPNSVTSIGDSAFSGCTNLTSITIPNRVTSIGGGAFSGCANLTSITIPNHVTSIEDSVFAWCTSLTSVTIPSGVTSIGESAFYDCTGLTSVTIPNSVTTIGDSVFCWCTSLTNVTIGSSVASIGDSVFSWCTGLSRVTIPSGVTSIGEWAFWDCASLTAVTIPNSVTNIGGGAFSGCGSLTSVTIPNSVTSIGGGAFSGCANLASVTIPNSVTSIGESAFWLCISLTNATIGNSVTSIGDDAFSGCGSLASVTIPDSVTNIGDDAFGECSSLKGVYFQGNAPRGAWDVFYDDNSVTNYYLFGTTGWGATFADRPAVLLNGPVEAYLNFTTNNGTITIMGYRTGLGGAVAIPATINGLVVASIGGDAFAGYSSLTNVTIPNGVISIGEGAFAHTGLTSVTIPDSVTSIGDNAFGACCNLTNITVPSSVFSIGTNAFWNCTSLTRLTIGNSVTNIGDTAFEGCFNLTGVTIGSSVTSIGENAFDGCTNLTSIVVPSSVISVGFHAFYDCTSLTAVYFQGNAPYDGSDVFWHDNYATVYYLLGTTGWGTTFGGVPSVLWNRSGTYNGLFADDTGSLSPQNCGCFTIIVTRKWAFSGSLRMGGTRYPLSGQFDPTGAASRTIARGNMSALTVNLQLDVANGTDRVTGSVSNGTWTAALAGDRAIYNGRTELAPEAGSYTLILAGAYGSTNEPAGDSYGTLTVGKNGAISFRGMLADGTKVTQRVPVSKYGQWPLCASLPGGQGVLWSWLTFTNASNLGGTVAWTKLPVKTPYYPAGFSLAAEALGARYFPPGKGTNVLGLTTSTDLTLTLEGDGLVEGITNGITLGANSRVTPVSGPKLSLTFTPSTGGFRGSVVNPATSKRVSFGGVLLQGQGFGSGFFLGTNECGEVRLEP
jgi:hypothetical protein